MQILVKKVFSSATAITRVIVMSLSQKELSNLLGFLHEEEIGNQTFESYSSAFQKAGFSKQVKM